MPSKMVAAQQLSDAGEDLARLAAAKDAETAKLKADFQNASDAADAYCAEIARVRASAADFEREAKRYRGELEIAKAEIAALTEQRDRAMAWLQEIADMEGPMGEG